MKRTLTLKKNSLAALQRWVKSGKSGSKKYSGGITLEWLRWKEGEKERVQDNFYDRRGSCEVTSAFPN